ncbi:MAG: DUF3775 domain-containing protein [Gammaproteobacteria bacterium]|nr:DUF3775 domain-containing protein [Gammaproteobacteria bacterium]
MAELELNRDTVRQIIDMAHEFHARDDVTFEEEPEVADEYWSDQVVADFGGDTYYQELKTGIEDLEPDQQISLVALMWLGRGDFSMSEWGEALSNAEDSWNNHTADYLIGTSLLADYLADGLQQFDSAESD